ncbi:MAG: DUF1361 domain-containing protein [Saprospiraceae bacterium]|jgi:uncharacterized membrane protein|nr:DUF1361 domain-containing protein [Saprospiraceae bacterium]
MIQLLKKHHRLHETLFMGALTLVCFSLSVFRYLYSETKVFLFLNWNLFLAFLPWAFTSLVLLRPGIQKSRLTVLLLLGAWLLFFPNAPYILTDLFHLRFKSSMPIWFDLVLILSFAWAGLLYGFLSLWDIERLARKYVNQTWVSVLSVGLLFLGSFGVYLGRYLRWNSWDIVSEPYALLYDVGSRIANPVAHPTTWGMTILLGIFLNMIYWSFRLIRTRGT